MTDIFSQNELSWIGVGINQRFLGMVHYNLKIYGFAEQITGSN